MKICRVCSGKNTSKVIDLGHHPLADRFLTREMLDQPETTYPLSVWLCADCGYAGNGHVVSERERYQTDDYSYTAGNSPVSRAHFAELASALVLRFGKPDAALDIGGNDGTLCQAIKERSESTARVINIEPSLNIAKLSRDAGVETFETVWPGPYWEASARYSGGFDLITATNVLNHASDPNAFVSEVSRCLCVGGVFAFEVPSLAELVRQSAFDTIYVEHVSYFGLKSLDRLLRAHGLSIVHAETVPYMGGSLRVFAQKLPCVTTLFAGEPREIYDPFTYAGLMTKVNQMRERLVRQLRLIRAADGTAFAIGAAAKGNTLLNYCRLASHDISFVVDTSPHKIGKWTPGSHIAIIDENRIPETHLGSWTVLRGFGDNTPECRSQHGECYAVILPWNIADHLIERSRHLPVKFITPNMME